MLVGRLLTLHTRMFASLIVYFIYQPSIIKFRLLLVDLEIGGPFEKEPQKLKISHVSFFSLAEEERIIHKLNKDKFAHNRRPKAYKNVISDCLLYHPS